MDIEPAYAQIPLPEGMNLKDVLDRVPVAIVVSVAAGVLFWDHLQLMPHELRAYYSTAAPHWRPWDLSTFVLLRYAGITGMIGFFFLHVVPQANCDAVWILVQATYIITAAAFGFLLTMRVSNLWNGDRSVTTWLGGLTAISIGCRVTVATQSHVREVKDSMILSSCMLDPFVSYLSIEHAASLAFDVFCLVFALGKLAELKRRRGVEFLHYQQCLVWIAAAIMGHTVLLVIQLLSSKQNAMKVAAAPYSMLISVAIGTRIALNMRSLRQYLRASEVHNRPGAALTERVSDVSVKIGRAPNMASPFSNSSTTSSPTLTPLPRKLSDPFTPSPMRSTASTRSRTPSPLPLAPLGANMQGTIREVEEKETLPDSPSAIATPRTAQSPMTPMSFAPASTPVTAKSPMSTTSVAGSHLSSATLLPGSPMSPIEFAPTAVPIGKQGRGALPTPPSSGSTASFMGQRGSAFGAGSPRKPPASAGGSKTVMPLPQNQYTTFPSPPGSAASSLTFTSPSKTSGFGNLARLKKGKQVETHDPNSSVWTE